MFLLGLISYLNVIQFHGLQWIVQDVYTGLSAFLFYKYRDPLSGVADCNKIADGFWIAEGLCGL